MIRCKQRQRKRRGAVMLEAAITFPLLLMVMIGIVDVGRMGYSSMVVSNACRVAADYAASNRDSDLFVPQWRARIEELMRQELAQIPRYSDDKATFTIQSQGTLAAGRKHVIVVTYHYEMIFRWPGTGGEVSIRDQRTVVNFQ